MQTKNCLLAGAVFGIALCGTALSQSNADRDHPYVVRDARFVATVRITQVAAHTITGENQWGKVTLSLKAPVSVWKCHDAPSVKVLAIGDEIIAAGTVQRDGSLVPDQITANIVRISGVVVRREGQVISVAETIDDRTLEKTVRLDERSIYEDGANQSDIGPKVRIEVIGCQLPDRTALASRVFVYTSSGASRHQQ